MQARAPQPAAGATGVSVATSLDWRPGREATSHQVYFGTDLNAVTQGTASSKIVTAHTFDPGALTLGMKYYWKVDEIGGSGPYAGTVWSFTTENFAVVDDFESYNDDNNRIYDTWIDGWANGTGSQVGYTTAPFAEQAIVHGGKQSMPLMYDNNKATHYSEAERTFVTPQDWTRHGATTLVIWFRGDPNNAAAPLYAKINDAKVLFNKGAPGTTFPLWKQWNIDLASAGTNLASVKTLTIGVGDGKASGTGILFIDDILLYAAAPQIVAPADPGTNGLVALYAMEGNVQDTSGKGNHGTLSGTATYGNGLNGYGKALKFNGLDNYVTLPIGNLLSTLSNITVATWVNYSGTGGNWQRIWDFGSGTTANMYVTPVGSGGLTGPMLFGIVMSGVAEQRATSTQTLPTGWHHVSLAIDGTAKTATLYLDGSVAATAAITILPKDLGVTTQNWIGHSQYTADSFFNGMIDDFRIYNRTISAAEIRYLVGDR